MSPNLPSEEVANDYKSSLEDLITNDRWQITNLTLIAKESIEHAEAISRVLQNHISRAPPQRKLPALYVLDSIVKNVGTPFTVYFGRNLRDIFLLAYSQVDAPIRRKLEEMLKTWREPVPGTLSTSPVFPIQSTQPIVDALNRYRANTPQPRPQQSVTLPNRVIQSHPFRSTPTPPQQLQHPLGYQPQDQPTLHYATQQYLQGNTYPQYPPATQLQSHLPAHLAPPHAASSPGANAPYPPHTASPSLPTTYNPQPQSAQYPTRQTSSRPVDVAKLHADIDDLTIDAKIDCASHPLDSGAQTKLATLQGLKEILDSGNLSNQDLVDVRNTVMQQMAKKLAPHRPTPPLRPPFPMTPSPQPFGNPQQPLPAPAVSTPPSFLNQTNLAELLRATQSVKSLSNSQANYVGNGGTGHYTVPMIPVTAASSAGEPQVLAQLRASGFFSNTSTSPHHAGTLLYALPHGLAGVSTADPMDVKFTSSSTKIPRPQLLTSFLNARPNQCTTCGRRFTSDGIGREKKARHLDWHFKTKIRMAESERRGQNRSWYVDEREWIASRENEDDAGAIDANGTIVEGLSPSTAAKKKVDYVRAPTDPALRNAPCPIDQEMFKSEWSEEVQDFIWKDAVKVGNRYYHASCFQEAKRDRDKDIIGSTLGSATAARTSTPDSVLGKRKADQEDVNGTKSRVKTEAG